MIYHLDVKRDDERAGDGRARIRRKPLHPLMCDITITPLAAHPRYPEFSAPQRRPEVTT
jgi:hypothetical protein